MHSWRERFLIFFSWSSIFILTGAMTLLVGHILVRGFPALNMPLIFGQTSMLDALLVRRQVFAGLFPALAGTMLLISGSMLLALPMGILSGIYMAEYAHGPLKPLFNLFLDVLAGIPSIVVGLAGLSLTIALHRIFPRAITPCLLISCLALALLVLPYLIRSTQTALENVDPVLRMTAPSLGATRLQNLGRVLLPQALPDIFSGIILATGRCAEDTAVIMLTGAVASAGIPHSLLDQYEALPFFIYTVSAQYSGPDELAQGYGAAILLLLLCAGLMLSALWLQRRLSTLLLYR